MTAFVLQAWTHRRFIVVELRIHTVNTLLWMNVLLVKLWVFSPLKLATVCRTMFRLIHLSVPGMIVRDQFNNHSRCVMDVVAAAFHKIFSSIHKATFVFCVLYRRMETSSESDSRALLVRSFIIILHTSAWTGTLMCTNVYLAL